MTALSNKCPYCNKRLKENTYWPYCSYHCEEWGGIYQIELYLERNRRKEIKDHDSKINKK